MWFKYIVWSSALITLISQSIASKCAPVHLIVARGSFEPQGEGISSSLSTSIKKRIPGATSEALVYPAVIPYSGSMAIGSVNMKKAITNYTQVCPESRLVLIGYSQGGSVILDALCGGGGHAGIGPHTEGITRAQGKNIKIVLSFGEPRFVAGMPYNFGTNNKTSGVSCSGVAFELANHGLAVCEGSKRCGMSCFCSHYQILV
jgi:acetylxylan esterase